MKASAVLENSLDIEISETSKQINAKAEDVSKLKADLNQFLNDKFNLNVAISQEVNNTTLNPTELLAEIERLQALEAQRLEKLGNVRQAEKLFKARIEQAKIELKQLQQQLTSLNDAKDWQINYLPKAEKYSQTFVTDFKNQNDRKIKDSENQLASYKQQLEKIQYFLNNPDPKLKQQSCRISDTLALSYGEAQRALNTIPNHISGLETSIECHTDYYQNWLECLNKNPDYRKFIRARVDIDKATKDLKLATDEYLSKLEAFKALKENCNTAIRYAENLGYSNNRIISVTIADYIQVTDMVINV